MDLNVPRSGGRTTVRRLLLLLILVVALVPTGGAAPASEKRPEGSAGVLALGWGDLDSTPRASRGNYLIMQPWEYPRIPALRAANPGITILMYKDVAAVVKKPHETGIYDTGVSYREASHHDWLLRDQSGEPLEWSDYAGLYPADVGDRGYQDRWAGNVLAELRAHQWDGVMMDDTLTYLSHPTVGNRTSVQIPDDASMYDATASFLHHVAGQVRDAGFLAIPNLTVEWNTWRSVVRAWTPYVSGWENEFAVKWGLDSSGARFVGDDWTWKTDLAQWCADRDVPLLSITYSNRDDVVAQNYHRATWLLTWNGSTGSSIFVPEEPATSHWVPRASVDIGMPTSRRVELASGVWRRAYTAGLALVNPTAHGHTVALGETYERLDGQRISSVRLPPETGAVLRR